MVTMNNAALVWIMFYIAAGILGILLVLVYLVFRRDIKKKK